MEIPFLVYFKIAVLAAIPFILMIKEKGFKVYNPAISLSVVVFLQFGLPAILIYKDPTVMEDQFQYFSLDALDTSLTFCILVYVFFLLGYYSPYYIKPLREQILFLMSKLPDLTKFNYNIENFPRLLLLLLTVGWISRLIIIGMGLYYHAAVEVEPIFRLSGFSLYAQYLSIFMQFPIIAIALCYCEHWKRNDKKYLVISLVLLFLEVIFALPSGSKERILLPIAIVIFLNSFKRKFPFLPLILSCAFFFLFVFPFVGIYRSIYLTGDVITDFINTLVIYKDLFKDFSLKTLFNITNAAFIGRLNNISIVSVLINGTPHIWDFKLGYSYLMFFVSLIPRIFWLSKPSISFWANEFGRDYGILGPLDHATSIDMTWIGEIFINFGWYGVTVGLLYGFLYQFLYSYFLRRKSINMLSVIFYSLTLYYMLRGSMFTIQFSGLLKMIFLTTVVMLPFLHKTEAKE